MDSFLYDDLRKILKLLERERGLFWKIFLEKKFGNWSLPSGRKERNLSNIFQILKKIGLERYIFTLSFIISKKSIISRLVSQNPFLFMFLIFFNQNHQIKDLLLQMPLSYQKIEDFISYFFCWILSTKYQIVQCVKKSISVHLKRNVFKYLSKWSQTSYAFFRFTW